MKVYFCNTAYQVIVALQISTSINFNDENALLISDIVPNAKQIVSNLKKNKGFEKSDFIEVKDLEMKEIMFEFPASILFRKKFAHTFASIALFGARKNIEEYYFANITGAALAVGIYLKSKNKGMRFSIYEDGVSSYSRIYEESIRYRLYNSSVLKRLRFKLFPSIVHSVDGFYVFSPELMIWKCPFTVKTIPKLGIDRNYLVKILNMVFDYENSQDTYDEKVIFFEESYVQDGIIADDMEIVEHLAEKYGKANVLIKNHPRVKNNRFLEGGFKTNNDTSIPWEVIALNKDISSKILVTMTSTAVVNTFLLFETTAKLVLEYEKLRLLKNQRIHYTIEVIDHLKTVYPDRFVHIL